MKKLISAIAAVATAVVTISPAQADNSHNAHKDLWRAIQEVGVTTTLNNPIWCNNDRQGMYDASAALMVICQQNATGRREVGWTQEDYDTLRHEAHHLVQDCNRGRVGDSLMAQMFEDNKELANFVSGAFTKEEVVRIAREYNSHGVRGTKLLMEIEAFAVARSVDAATIANKVREWCK